MPVVTIQLARREPIAGVTRLLAETHNWGLGGDSATVLRQQRAASQAQP